MRINVLKQTVANALRGVRALREHVASRSSRTRGERHRGRSLQAVVAVALVVASFASQVAAEEHVVVVAESASPLEKLAANEISRILGELQTGEKPNVVGEAPAGDATAIVVGVLKEGSPAAAWVGAPLPELGEESLLLRSERRDGRDALIVAGGSPRAVLWAAYELGERLGMTYLLTGDIAPAKVDELKLPTLDVLLEPRMPRRAWVVLDASPSGLWGWSRQERRRLIGQLAKLKYNQVEIEIETWQPLVRFEFGGVAKKPRRWWVSDPLAVDGDIAGRAAFKGAKEFINPDLEGKTGEELTDAGIALIHAAIDDAHEFGMKAAIAISARKPFEWSLPAEFAAILPNAKFIDANSIGGSVRRRIGDKDQQLISEAIAAQAKAFRNTYPSADYVGNFFSEAFRDAAEEARHLARIGTVNDMHAEIGMLPQEASSQLAVFDRVEEPLYFRMKPRCIADCDVLAWRLSQLTWGPRNGEAPGAQTLLQKMVGEGADERASLALSFIHKAAKSLSDESVNDIGPDMIWRHYQSTSPAPKAWTEATDHYIAAMNEMYRAHDRANPRARPWLRYFTKRLEFAMEYLACLSACRAAGVAREKGDSEEQIAQLEAAVESLYNGLQAYSEVARDPCDRGAIAVLNTYGYRRLKDEVDRLTSE